jgi:hypothetical protein
MEVAVARARSVSLREDIAQCVTLIKALESDKLNDIDHPQARISEQKRKLVRLELELAESVKAPQRREAPH